ncbi:Endonuclease/exonuclease/phosphatase OS=Lysinibacillus sphaericus OX=1421 GN=LS41612_19835 PE=4 SV=1 [Lysinibacillus sphaericus]
MHTLVTKQRIVGVTEVQDNNGESAGDAKADQSYQRLIDAIKAESGIDYKYEACEYADGGGDEQYSLLVSYTTEGDLKEGIQAGDGTAVSYQNVR